MAEARSKRRSHLSVWLDGIQGLSAGLIACVVIVVSGLGLSVCAMGIRDYAVKSVSENINIKSPFNALRNILSAKDNIYVIPKYTNALALANINLEALPALDSNIFLDIVTAIPEDVHIDDFTFVESQVVIFGTSTNPDAIFTFIYSLKKSESFKEVKAQFDEKNDPYSFSIECQFNK